MKGEGGSGAPAEGGYAGPPPWLAVATWICLPILFCGGCWTIAFFPGAVAKILPRPIHTDQSEEEQQIASASEGIVDSLLKRRRNGSPLTPQEKIFLPPDRFSAWLVGRAVGRMEASPSSESQHMIEAADAIGVSVEELDRDILINLGDLIQMADARGSGFHIGHWLSQFFTIVNCFWLIGIIGLTATVVPFLMAIGGPYLEWLANVLVDLYRVLQRLEVLWELCFWLACLYLVAVSLCCPRGSRELVAISGCVLTMAGYSYAVDYISFMDFRITASFQCFYLCLSLVPLVNKLQFDSGLLGFVAAFALFGGLLSLIYESVSQDVDAWSVSAFLVTLVLLVLKLLGAERVYGPYRIGLYFFGPLIFLSAFLIGAGWWEATAWLSYTVRNAMFLIIIAAMYFFGTVIDYLSFRNTAISFMAVWVYAKFMDTSLLVGEGHFAVESFITFLGIWLAAVFLRSNPEWSKSLIP